MHYLVLTLAFVGGAATLAVVSYAVLALLTLWRWDK